MKKRVVIIGGGLAGLSTAFYLLKDARDKYEVIIVERDKRLGGRVHSVDVASINIDIGGFMIMPFYRHMISLVRDLGLKKDLKRTKRAREFYQLRPNGPMIPDKDIPVSTLAPLSLLWHVIKPILEGRVNFYEPDLDLFDGETAHDFYRNYIKGKQDSERMVDELFIAYTYAPLSLIPASFFVSAAEKLLTHGMLNFFHYIAGGMGRLIDACSKEIKLMGGFILPDRTVKEIAGKKIIFKDGSCINADIIVCATFPTSTLYPKLFKTNKSHLFTKYYTAIVEMDKPAVIKSTPWSVSYFCVSNLNKNPQIASIGQCSDYSESTDKYLTININVHHDDKHEYSHDEISIILKKELKAIFGSSNDYVGIKAIEYWPETMPIANIDFLKEIRSIQGKGDRYFAGDYTGIPCMETAVYSGKKVADILINK